MNRVNIHMLKEAKRAKLKQMHEQKACNGQHQHPLALEGEKEDGSRHPMMPPPRRAPMVPSQSRAQAKPTTVLPLRFFDDGQTRMTKLSSRALPLAGLPSGFFDQDGGEGGGFCRGGGGGGESNSSSGGSLRVLALYGSDDDADNGEESRFDHQSSPQPQPPNGNSDRNDKGDSGGGSEPALPAGFFDSAEADMWARGIGPGTAKQADNAREIEAFMEYAVAMGTEAGKSETAAEEAEEDWGQRARVEQMLYMNRLTPLLKKATQNKTISAAVDMAELRPESRAVDRIMTEVPSLLIQRRRTKKRTAAAAFQGAYAPLNPLDWRSRAGT